MAGKAADGTQEQRKQTMCEVNEQKKLHVFLNTFMFSLEFSVHKKIFVWLGYNTIVDKR